MRWERDIDWRARLDDHWNMRELGSTGDDGEALVARNISQASESLRL